LIEKAAGLWGKAGLRSQERSALVEAIEQLTRALGQVAALPATPALRREEIKLQVAIITPLLHIRGFAAPGAKAAEERARLLIEQAQALGEPPEDPLLLFAVLYAFWATSYIAFNGDAMCELSAQFLAFAEKQGTPPPLLIAHRIVGSSLTLTGNFVDGRAHHDRAIALYDPAEHRPLATRFGQDARTVVLCYRSIALWSLGYPDAALADTSQAINDAREFGQAGSLMFALLHASLTHAQCGNFAAANAEADELAGLANEKGALFWKALGTSVQGCVFALTGKPANAAHVITSGIAALRSTGATMWAPLHLSYLASAYAELRRCIGEAITAIETTREKWFDADVHRMAGEIALKSPEPDAAKAQAYFERALAVARQQQAKSWNSAPP
jgi:tetratricopeptide (TPR) repeat protein